MTFITLGYPHATVNLKFWICVVKPISNLEFFFFVTSQYIGAWYEVPVSFLYVYFYLINLLF